MTFGTLYYHPDYARSNWLVALGDYLDIEIKGKIASDSPEFAKLFPLRKTPAFITPDGFKLTESLAIAFYIINKSSNPDFAGKTVEEKATNWRWYSFITSDMVGAVGALLKATTEEEKSAAYHTIYQNLDYFENNLSESNLLVGNSILVCDIFARSYFAMLDFFKINYSSYHKTHLFIAAVTQHPIFSRIQKK